MNKCVGAHNSFLTRDVLCPSRHVNLSPWREVNREEIICINASADPRTSNAPIDATKLISSAISRPLIADPRKKYRCSSIVGSVKVPLMRHFARRRVAQAKSSGLSADCPRLGDARKQDEIKVVMQNYSATANWQRVSAPKSATKFLNDDVSCRRLIHEVYTTIDEIARGSFVKYRGRDFRKLTEVIISPIDVWPGRRCIGRVKSHEFFHGASSSDSLPEEQHGISFCHRIPLGPQP